jgi:hypothetical protein
MADEAMRWLERPDGTLVWEAELTREMVRELFPEVSEEQLDQAEWPLRIELKPWLRAEDGTPPTA